MTKAGIDLLWFVVAIVFFLIAMIGAKNKAVYIALGAVFLILGIASRRKARK
jgi:hypothetical protein